MEKLLVGITLSRVGGGQKVVYDIISRLPEERYAITLVTAPGGELLEWIQQLNASRRHVIKVITLLSLRRNISPMNDLKCLVDLMKIMRKGSYDIAHFHSSKMGVLGRVAAKLMKIPRIYYTVHGWCVNKETTGILYGAMSLIERLAARLSTGVVFVSSHDQKVGIQRHWAIPDRSRVIHNGITEIERYQGDIRSKVGVAKDEVLIMFTARLAEPKEPAAAIKAIKRVREMGFDCKLAIIGDGQLRAQCEACIEALQLKDTVFLLGMRNDVRQLLPQADIFLLLSKWEGLPISILEAMSAGLPVIASRVGGISELVEHRVSGYLVDDCSVEDTATYIVDLIKSAKRRREMGEAGHKMVQENFNVAQMINGYQDLYAG